MAKSAPVKPGDRSIHGKRVSGHGQTGTPLEGRQMDRERHVTVQ
jgi:hypothetical protein